MSNKVELGEIVYCNLTVNYKGKKYELKEIVYKNDGCLFNKKYYLQKININEPVEIENIKIIKRLGFKNNTKKYTKVKASNEKRNNTTGAYE